MHAHTHPVTLRCVAPPLRGLLSRHHGTTVHCRPADALTIGCAGALLQFVSRDPTTGAIAEVSASGAYMVAQCALPWASPGHLRGLTLQRLFSKVLDIGAPDLFMSRCPPVALIAPQCDDCTERV